LGERLLALARRIPPGSAVADIGTDHGFLPAHLERAGLAERVIATDSSLGSLASASRTRALAGCSFDLRLGRGLAPLRPGEAGVLVLAGLGGQTIAEALSEGADIVATARLAIVQPMKDLPQFRRWAASSHLTTDAEDIVDEGGRIYNVLTLSGVDRFAPAEWDASETGIEYEITRPLLANDKNVLLRHLKTRSQIRHHMASARAATQPDRARKDREVALLIDQDIAAIEGRL
jgi:tRNA (adenine22-N1)-methyltransferase